MDVKKLALLVGALAIAVVTAVMAKNMFAGAGAQQAAAATVPTGPKVLVAKKAMPVGTIIDADSFTFQPWPKELMQGAYYVEGQPDSEEPGRHGGSLCDRGRPAGHPRLARRSAGSRLPRRGAWPWNARRDGSREHHFGRRRFHFPWRPRRPHADSAGRRRRRWRPAEGFRDDRSQRARPRNRPALHRQGRRRQDAGQDRIERDVRGDARRSPRRLRSRRAWVSCRCRCARSPTTAPSSSARSRPVT